MTDSHGENDGEGVVLPTRPKTSRNKKKKEKKMAKKRREREAAAAEASAAGTTGADTEDTGYESKIDVEGTATPPPEETVSSASRSRSCVRHRDHSKADLIDHPSC